MQFCVCNRNRCELNINAVNGIVTNSNGPHSQYSFGTLTTVPIKSIGADVFVPQTTPVETPSRSKILTTLQESFWVRLFPEKFVEKYASREFLEKAIKSNPKIAQILESKGLSVNITSENITEIVESHLIPTMQNAKLIMDKSAYNFSPQDYDVMTKAALLHDIGKVLIPPEILNKKETLTKRDKEIISLHDELGYEILRSSNLSPKVLELIRSHHNYSSGKEQSDLAQILSIADIYSALKENRAYKKSMSDDVAFKVLDDKVKEGKFDSSFVSALKVAQNYNQEAKVA